MESLESVAVRPRSSGACGRRNSLRSHAMATGDYDVANLTVGESVGLVHDVPKARDVVERTIAEAEARFEKFASGVAAKSAA